MSGSLQPHAEKEPRQSSRIIDRFGQRAALVSADVELEHLLGETAAELGFDFFAIVHHAALSRLRPRLIRIHNYPGEWAEELRGPRLLGNDPVHQASVRTNIGFAWSELCDLVEVGRAERGFLGRALDHDIADGFTIPVNVPGEPAGSCSFALRRGRPLPASRLLCAEQIGLHAFRAARRIHGYPAPGRRPRLSPRELQCLRLVAAGKTDWEIAAILAISLETAHQYVKRARAAYDVASRTQLAACGLRDSIVGYDEAIPPSG